MGAAFYLARQNQIDGMIYITSFGCGIDSFVADMCERDLRRNSKIPFFLMMIDEHSGESGLETRLKAFIDMLKRKKSKTEVRDENNFSPYGEYIYLHEGTV